MNEWWNNLFGGGNELGINGEMPSGADFGPGMAPLSWGGITETLTQNKYSDPNRVYGAAKNPNPAGTRRTGADKPQEAGAGNEMAEMLSENAGLLTGMGAIGKLGGAYFGHIQKKHMRTIQDAQKNIDLINNREEANDAHRALLAKEAEAEKSIIDQAEEARQKFAGARSAAAAKMAGTGAGEQAIDDVTRKGFAVKQRSLDAMHKLEAQVAQAKGDIQEVRLNADLRHAIKPPPLDNWLTELANVLPGMLISSISGYYAMSNMVGNYDDYKYDGGTE